MNKEKDKKKLPYNVLKKSLLSTLLGATMMAGTTGLITGCDEGFPPEVPLSNISFYSGVEVPNTTANPAEDGDFYLETDTLDIYKYSNNAWEKLGTLKGDTGQTGASGINGATWYSGDTTPTTVTGYKEGDFFLNEDTNEIFKLTGTGWSKVTTIEDGVDGDNGLSAYQIAVENGFVGDEEAWLESLNGRNGEDGLTPFINNTTGTWWIGTTDTGVKAKGEDGVVPTITITAEGYWKIGDTVTEHSAIGKTGATIVSAVEVFEDDWGIKSHFEFTLNDKNNTVVKTASVTNVQVNYYYNATSGADIVKLIELGAENIKLANDIEMNQPMVMNSNLSIDLNNKKLTYLNKENPIIVEDGNTLEMFDGEMDFACINTIAGNIKVMANSSLILNEVKYLSEGTCVLVRGDAAKLEVKDSELIGGTYAISTNAASEENHNVFISLKNSRFDVTGYSQDPESSDCFDDAAILINVPSIVNIKDCEVEGDRQAVIVRGGDVTIEDCKLINTGYHYLYNKDNYSKYYDSYDEDLMQEVEGAKWGDGNNVPMATLVVGNNSSGYQYATNLVLRNTELVSKKAEVLSLWIDSNTEEGKGTTVVYAQEELELGESLRYSMISENATVMMEISDYYTLYSIMQAAEYGFNIVPLITQDIVVEDNITYELKLIFDEYNNTIGENGYKFYYNNDNVFASVYTSEQYISAINNGIKNITILQNITLDTVVNYNGIVNIDLNGNSIYSETTAQTVIQNGANVSFTNGNLFCKTAKVTSAAIKVMKDSSLNLDSVSLDSNGVAVYCNGDAAQLNVNQSEIKAQTYGVATNANDVSNYNVQIYLRDSQIITAGYNSENPDNTAVFINVPSQVTINNCQIKGDRQGMIVRGGDVVVTNSTIETTGLYTTGVNKYLDTKWGADGNEVPMAALVVGNRHDTSYQYATHLAMENVTINSENVPRIYVYSNIPTEQDPENKTYIYYSNTDVVSNVVIGEDIIDYVVMQGDGEYQEPAEPME